MKQHQDLMADILENGTVKGDRTGTGTISKFGGMMKFSIQHGLWPIPTTREVNHQWIAQELEWMMKGMISVQWLKDHKNPIWDSWMGEQSGTIGPMYGEQWRNWNAGIGKELSDADKEHLKKEFVSMSCRSYPIEPIAQSEKMIEMFDEFLAEKTKSYEQGGRSGTDQFMYIVNELKNNPDSRRMCLSVWHAALLPDVAMQPKENADAGRMALAPCHSMWQVDTKELTDMEILREIIYADGSLDVLIDHCMEDCADKASTELVKLISTHASIQAMSNGWCSIKRRYAPNEDGADAAGWKNLNPNRDDSYEISPRGRRLIEEYIMQGKPTRKLSLLCFARSQDVPLGTVFNVGEYSLLGHYLAHMTNMVPWEYTHLMGDHHIYSNQVEKVELQLSRTPMRPCRINLHAMPENPDHFDHRRIVVDYVSHEKINFPRAAV